MGILINLFVMGQSALFLLCLSEKPISQCHHNADNASKLPVNERLCRHAYHICEWIAEFEALSESVAAQPEERSQLSLELMPTFVSPSTANLEGDNCTDILGYNDTAYRDTHLTLTILVNPMLPKSVTVSKYLLTVTLFPCPEGVTVTKDVCIV